MLSQLAGEADEGGGTRARPARTLPSFWAAKAALERQRQRHEAAAAGLEKGLEGDAGGSDSEDGGARPGKRQRTEEGEASLARGQAADEAADEAEEVSSFR